MSQQLYRNINQLCTRKMVEFIKYKDEELPISLNMGILLELQKAGLDLDSKDSVKSYEAMMELFWLSLEHGHFHENKDMKIKKENIRFYFSTCLDDFREKMRAFTSRLEEEKKSSKGHTIKERLKKTPKKQA